MTDLCKVYIAAPVATVAELVEHLPAVQAYTGTKVQAASDDPWALPTYKVLVGKYTVVRSLGGVDTVLAALAPLKMWCAWQDTTRHKDDQVEIYHPKQGVV
jgi:predicted transcriptional regulator YdeE